MPSILDTTKQFWNILNMYPDIHSPELQERIDTFVIHADVNAFFQMQKGLFDFATPYFMEDERISALMCGLDGKKIGLSIEREYQSTLIFRPEGFDMIWGIKRGYPVLIVVSREDYRDAKPAPDAYLTAAERLGLAASECAVVEDTPRGLGAALAAGMRAVALPNELTADNDFTGCTVQLSHLDELTPALLRRL